MIWLPAVLARALEPHECEAVLGDLEERKTGTARACWEVLGLVARRQLQGWAHWRAWATLVVLVLPSGVLLSVIARWWTDGLAINAYLSVGNWTWSYLDSPGARRDLWEALSPLPLQGLALILWACTLGYAIGRSYGRTALSVALAWGAMAGVAFLSRTTTARGFGGNDAVFSSLLYGAVLPWATGLAVVIIPALAAMVVGIRRRALSLKAALLCAVAAAAITAWLGRRVERSVTFGMSMPPAAGGDGIVGTGDDERPMYAIPFILLLPTVWTLAGTVRRRTA